MRLRKQIRKRVLKMENNDIQFDFVERLGDERFASDGGSARYKLPKKGTKKAAGYDFFNPETVVINPGQIVNVKTGIKAKFPNDVGLLLLNRSSNPIKKGLVLANGIGLVDADYYNNPDNEGEIAFSFLNMTSEPVTINEGDKLGQGMFIKYLDVTSYDESEVSERVSGFGSTGM